MKKFLCVGVDCSLREGRLGVCAFVTSAGERRFCYSTSRLTPVLEMEAILFALESLEDQCLNIYTDSKALVRRLKNKKCLPLIQRVQEIQQWRNKKSLVLHQASRTFLLYQEAHRLAYDASKTAPLLTDL